MNWNEYLQSFSISNDEENKDAIKDTEVKDDVKIVDDKKDDTKTPE